MNTVVHIYPLTPLLTKESRNFNNINISKSIVLNRRYSFSFNIFWGNGEIHINHRM
jgi:hypothetical protein